MPKKAEALHKKLNPMFGWLNQSNSIFLTPFYNNIKIGRELWITN